MAAEGQPVGEQITPSTSEERSFSGVFMPEDTLDHPCDVVLVVEDGKEFKAHRKVLSEASPFFEKLLSSDMKESKEGIVRLEMFSESVMAATLEFIYTGHVQILTEDNARDLIVMADYLFLQKLKTLAENVLAQKLNISNCISTYYFSQRYQCEELLSKSKKFILANFTAVYAANREDVLNMSSKEVEMWISSDEIDVSAEEDVFKIILAWIDHDKDKRKKYFAELFRQVRLVYVSRDFLSSDVVTNDLVKENKDCLDLVKEAIGSVDSKICAYLSILPRKSLGTPAIVMRTGSDFRNFLCYFLDADSWYRLGKIPPEFNDDHFYHCKGKLCRTKYTNCVGMNMVSYCPYAKSWMRLPPLEEHRWLWQMFVRNEDEIWALLGDRCYYCHLSQCRFFISQYKPESHSWEVVSLLDHLQPFERDYFCIVASDQFIYFIGGTQEGDSYCLDSVYLSNVDRYDVNRNQWDKVADIQVARTSAHGAAANGKVFIAGGYQQEMGWLNHSYEMYDESTNEWQFISSIKKPKAFETILAADGHLHTVSREIVHRPGCKRGFYLQQITIECYDPEKNEWKVKSQITFSVSGRSDDATPCHPCSMRIFKGLLSNIRPLKTTSVH